MPCVALSIAPSLQGKSYHQHLDPGNMTSRASKPQGLLILLTRQRQHEHGTRQQDTSCNHARVAPTRSGRKNSNSKIGLHLRAAG